jgi:hypothetical protein
MLDQHAITTYKIQCLKINNIHKNGIWQQAGDFLPSKASVKKQPFLLTANAFATF